MLRGRPEYRLWRWHQNLYLLANQDDLMPGQFFLFRIHLWTQEILVTCREPLEPQWFWRSAVSNWICPKNNLDFYMIWSYDMAGTHVKLERLSKKNIFWNWFLISIWFTFLNFFFHSKFFKLDWISLTFSWIVINLYHIG